MSDTTHGMAWEKIADWRYRWVTVAVTVIIAASGSLLAYGRLTQKVDESALVVSTASDITIRTEREVANLVVRTTGLEHRLDEHVQMPVHTQTAEAVGRMDERLKGVETSLRRMDEKLDRLIALPKK